MDKSDNVLNTMPRKLKSLMSRLQILLNDIQKEKVLAHVYREDVADLRLDIA